MATLFLATTLHLLHLVVILDKPAVQLITLMLLVEGERGTDASLCAASVSGVQSLITCSLSALTLSQ